MAIPFTITPTSGQSSFVVQPNAVNGPLYSVTNSDLHFVGMNKRPYGELLNTNLYRLLENFACPERTFPIDSISSNVVSIVGNLATLFSDGSTVSIVDSSANNNDYVVSNASYNQSIDRTEITLNSNVPDDTVADGRIGYPGLPQNEVSLGNGNGINVPTKGQLWYNTSTNTLSIYNGSDWITTNKVQTGSVQPTDTPEQGYLWYDTSNNQLNVYDSDTGGWTSVGHRYVRLDGTSTMTGSLDLGSNKVVNVVDPTNPQETATKNYVDVELDNLVLNDISDVSVGSPSADDGVYWDGSQWVNGHHFVLVSGDTITGSLTVNSDLSTGGAFDATGNSTIGGYLTVGGYLDVGSYLDVTGTITSGGNGSIGGDLSVTGDLTTGALTATADGTTLTYDGHAIWHAGNDGSGSGLDADLWDGAQKYVSTSDPTSTDGNDGDIWFKL